MPIDKSVTMLEVAKAAHRRVRADTNQKAEATEDLRTRCRHAYDAGVPITEIASMAGLSSQGVHDLLGQA